MPRPLVTVIAPTIGRPTLRRLLYSIRSQAPADECEILVVADTYQGKWHPALRPVPALCEQYQARYLEYGELPHCVGHPQRNFGMTKARGKWLMFSQDDAMLAQGAWATIRATLTAAPSVPHLFQVETWQAGVVPKEPLLMLGNVDADCIAVPNHPKRLARWTMRYAGDFDFIADTCDNWRRREVWVDRLIAYGRPDASQDWTWRALEMTG
jgi:hypothetical protein